MTFIDINQIHAASVARLRAHGCSDREILEFANAPEVASCIDEVPTCYRALFSEGDTEAKILARWNAIEA